MNSRTFCNAGPGVDGFVGQLDIEVFARRLGLDGSNKARKRTVQQMLIKSGSDLTISDLDDIVAVGRALASFDIPNVSAFIARRGAIGGLQGIINGVVPGLALLGGSGAAAGYTGSNVIGAILFIGGSHLFARVISNPKSARALHQVFAKETTSFVRRKAAIAALRGGLQEMSDFGEISESALVKLEKALAMTIEAMDNQIKAFAE